MAEKIVSPGVFTRENDLSFISQGIGEIGAAIIGPFKKGPAFVPTIVNTQSEFEEIFGVPDGTYYTGYTVQNYLREAGTVTIVKVGHLGGYTMVDPVGIVVSGSRDAAATTGSAGARTLVGTLFATENGTEGTGFPSATNTIECQLSSSTFNISGSQLGTAVSASVIPASGSDIRDLFGESPLGSKNAYVYKYFENNATNQVDYFINSGSSVEFLSLADQDFNVDTQRATTPYIKSQLISGQRHNLFRFHTISHGTDTNQAYKISVFNVKPAGSNASTDYATFSIAVRKFSDTDKRKNVLETFNNVNLDPASPQYIKKVIGDRYITIDSDGKQTETGDYANYSDYIYVECVAEGAFPITSAPFGHGEYQNPINISGTATSAEEDLVPAVIFSTGSDSNTASSKVKYAGMDIESATIKIDNKNYVAPIPQSAGTGSNGVFAFDTSVQIDGSTHSYSYEMTGSAAVDIAKRQFTVMFQSGYDGVSPTIRKKLGSDITAGNSQGFNLTNSTSSGSVAYVKAINAISNPDDFDINLVSAPGVIRRLHSYVFDKIVDTCEDRADCFFIGDTTAHSDTIAQATTQADAVDSNYVGTYYPWVKTIDINTNKLTAVPPSVLMPGIYAANDRIAAEWFAPAGLNRGGIVGAVSVMNRLTHAERDTLYEGKVNPIASFPGEGIVAFGQKTLQDKASALDRINVRRLLIKVKKFVASTSRYLIFEQNTAQTRNRFINTVQPYLEGVQQRQGLYAFKVVMDETNNTPDVIDRNILAGQIFLQPTKTAEFIVIDFNILPTGASFSA
tara:strand:+ start:8642 stop:11020 length:2379 start_codon:yes stop_codon:yes gene_type:complete